MEFSREDVGNLISWTGEIYDLCRKAMAMIGEEGEEWNDVRETIRKVMSINTSVHDMPIMIKWEEDKINEYLDKYSHWSNLEYCDSSGRSRPPRGYPMDEYDPVLESPIEEMFWDAYVNPDHSRPGCMYGLKPQYQVLDYRLDFALPDFKIGIELDGFASHSSTKAIAHDRERQRNLEAEGWRIIRFGGLEVFRDAHECLRQAEEIVIKWTGEDPQLCTTRRKS